MDNKAGLVRCLDQAARCLQLTKKIAIDHHILRRSETIRIGCYFF